MKSKIWLIGYFIIIVCTLVVIGGQVVRIDPFFHYHEPNINSYYYVLDNERSQNDGISKHFQYNAMITGTSMTRNFKTSEFDDIFGVNSIKVPYSGGSYKEINNNISRALSHNRDLKIIVRGLDMGHFLWKADYMRTDLGAYPTYLYDNNILNDVNYVFNRDVIFNRVYAMMNANDADDFQPGITSFDDYGNFMAWTQWGVHTVYPEGVNYLGIGEPIHLSQEEKMIIDENVEKNVTSIAEQYPNVTFYYFFPPYSAAWWQVQVEGGTIYKQIEAEQYIIEKILQYSNIKLYSFNNRTDIITNMNNYKDSFHYGSWINSLILKWMHEGEYQLTWDNYKEYIESELKFYSTFDYGALENQIDYENDYYAEALLCEELSGVKPLYYTEEMLKAGIFKSARLVCKDDVEIECVGVLNREPDSEINVGTYLYQEDYTGVKIRVNDITAYKYLVFEGKKNTDYGQPSVYFYDENGNGLGKVTAGWQELDNEWHQYLFDVTDYTGTIDIIFNGGYIDNSGDEAASFSFRDITLY